MAIVGTHMLMVEMSCFWITTLPISTTLLYTMQHGPGCLASLTSPYFGFYL